MMRVNTNVGSIKARAALGRVSREKVDNSLRMSSSSRVYQASFDPAGMAISTKMNSKIRSSQQAIRNTNDSISMIQTAEGNITTISTLSNRMRQLAVSAATDTISDDERGIIDYEFQTMSNEIKRVIESAAFNGQKILDSNELDFQIGIHNTVNEDRITYDPQKVLKSFKNLGLHRLSMKTKEGSRQAFADLDRFLHIVSKGRAELGSLNSRVNSVVSHLETSNVYQTKAKSMIADTDIAKASAANARLNILESATLESLKQVNAAPKLIAKLIG
ncbi:MAG: flagellin FliC [Bacteriovoracaceae bacterium]|jgi:flagellin|nr:flagellin FliC [Bacteriovoracaceae bacterium]